MTGRPTSFKEDMVQIAEDYINGGYEKEGDKIPSHAGLAILLNVNKSTLYEWAKKESHPFSNILAKCNAKQERVLLNKGLSGEFNSNITKLALGKQGYSDKQETEHKGGLSVSFDSKDADTL